MSFFRKLKRVLPYVAIAAAPFALPALLPAAAGGAAAGAAASGGLAGSLGGALGTLGQLGGAFSGITGIMSAIRGEPKININTGGGPVAPAQAAPEAPITRPDAMARPSSLAGYAGFTPEQERSALATKGSNIGLGSEEDAYYRNLIQRSLIGEGNTIAEDQNSLLPVESQYLSRQGVNTSNIRDLLKQIRGTA